MREAAPAERITVVAHSYAGIPVTQGLCADGSAVGAVPADWWAINPKCDIVDPVDPVRHFYSDLPAEQAQQAAAKLRHQRLSSFTQKLTCASWRQAPTDYIVLDQDGAIPPVAQQAMAARASQVHHLQTSHSPFLSRPAELAKLLCSQER